LNAPGEGVKKKSVIATAPKARARRPKDKRWEGRWQGENKDQSPITGKGIRKVVDTNEEELIYKF